MKQRFPWWGWVPYLLLAIGAGIWALTHWGAVISGARSLKAVGFGAAAVILCVVLLFAVARLTRRGWAGQLAGLVPLVAAGVVAVLPSYIPTTANDAAPAGLPPVQTDSSAPPQPSAGGVVEIGSASFVGIDHDTTGIARLIKLEDGSLLVRFEQFDVEPGPDYDVYLLTGSDVQSPKGGHALGDLRGTSGDQNYTLPADAVGTDEVVTVLIWCELFDVPVANATIGG